jgi:hypothetical protein
MRFEFGPARDLQPLATAIFLQGFADSVFFLLLNGLMVCLCGWAALKRVTWIWRKAPTRMVNASKLLVPLILRKA